MQTTACVTTELLTSSDVSRLALGEVTPAAVRLAGVTGRLRVAAVTPHGQRLYTRADALEFLARRARQRETATGAAR